MFHWPGPAAEQNDANAPGLSTVALRLGTAGLLAVASLAQAQGQPEAPPSAEIRAIAEHVNKRTYPDLTWTAVLKGDPLKAQDGLRTFDRSSAELAFDDGSRLLLAEQSIVVLGRSAAPTARRAVELLAGQADLVQRSVDAQGLELLIGEARAVARPTSIQGTHTRGRRGDNGQAQVMVYRGEGDVESGGKRVRVPQGQGTRIPRGGTPEAPQRLLPAPLTGLPGTAVRLDHSNPRFTWDVIAGATSYVVEVCRDASCGSVVERASVARGTWTPHGLPLGQLYWRVTAVGASGLDGYPSEPQPLVIVALWRRPEDERETSSYRPALLLEQADQAFGGG